MADRARGLYWVWWHGKDCPTVARWIGTAWTTLGDETLHIDEDFAEIGESVDQGAFDATDQKVLQQLRQRLALPQSQDITSEMIQAGRDAIATNCDPRTYVCQLRPTDFAEIYRAMRQLE